ncbi:pyroglutamyl-peptidase 1-like [Babylonia areolata]|uniref:pyroglutamyl-peptidase 1-like n=1 Tax=Babylonia areolata TaxID=304850 RepID=UPI003FCF0072
MPSTKPFVVITGFGPFGSHRVNASSVAVMKLQEEGLDNDSVELLALEIPVEYEAVKQMVPKLWEQYNPLLMVHVGVSGIATELTFEQIAHNEGYDKIDVLGRCPETQCCVDAREKTCVLVSGINMKKVCTKVCASGSGVKARVSHDAGRYLCEFSYFSSLHISHHNTAFIHVPPLDSPYSAQQLVQGLRVAINEMIQQLTSP